MPVQGRTRKQLRQSIGYNLGVLKAGTATGGTNNTLIDVNTFRGGDDTYNGNIIIVKINCVIKIMISTCSSLAYSK